MLHSVRREILDCVRRATGPPSPRWAVEEPIHYRATGNRIVRAVHSPSAVRCAEGCSAADRRFFRLRGLLGLLSWCILAPGGETAQQHHCQHYDCDALFHDVLLFVCCIPPPLLCSGARKLFWQKRPGNAEPAAFARLVNRSRKGFRSAAFGHFDYF